jgi:hypothetical protein
MKKWSFSYSVPDTVLSSLECQILMWHSWGQYCISWALSDCRATLIPIRFETNMHFSCFAKMRNFVLAKIIQTFKFSQIQLTLSLFAKSFAKIIKFSEKPYFSILPRAFAIPYCLALFFAKTNIFLQMFGKTVILTNILAKMHIFASNFCETAKNIFANMWKRNFRFNPNFQYYKKG